MTFKKIVLPMLMALGLLFAPLGVVTTPAIAVTTDSTCIGAPGPDAATVYPQTRQFVESQSWWMPGLGQVDDAATHHGHGHLGACIPERETLTSGNLTVNARVMMHDNPGTANYVSMVFKGTDYETTVKKCYVRASMTDFTCPSASSTGRGDLTCAQPNNCERWLTFSIPISSFNHSGLQEVRLRSFIKEPGSKEMHSSINFQVYVQNGKSTSNVTREPNLRGKGWYTHSLYCESAYKSVPIPDAPVSGVWSPTLEQTTHDSDASLPVTHSFITLDPNFHASPPVLGTILHDADGGYGPLPSPIDTTTLTNGVHKLYQKVDCRDDTLGSTNSGVLVIPFVVAN